MSFFGEVKRRNVVKVGAAYLVVAWLLIQVASTVLPTFDAPRWAVQSLTFVVILGYPVALVLAWVYELTPEGIKRTIDVPAARSITPATGRRLNYVIIGALAFALGFVVLDNYVLDKRQSDPTTTRFPTDRGGSSTAIGPELYPVGPPITGRATPTPEGNRMVAVSPDGTLLAYDWDNTIWLQTLGQQDARPIATGRAPFFSSDGQWIGFAAVDSLMKISVQAHAALAIAPLPDAAHLFAASWVDQTIVFATQTGVYRVAANLEGEEAELVLPTNERETYAWPELLPGGRSVLLTVISGASFSDTSIAVLDLETRQLGAPLFPNAVGARYIPSNDTSGRVVYAVDQQGHLAMRDFDPTSGAVGAVGTESAEIVVRVHGTYFSAAFDVADIGSVLYVGAVAREPGRLAWIDHDGTVETIDAQLPDGVAAFPRISPDGSRVAFDAGGGGLRRRIWTMDFDRNTPIRLTDWGAGAPYADLGAAWSRDGSRIFFASRRVSPSTIWVHAADGFGNDEQVIDDSAALVPADLAPYQVAPDGRIVAFRGPSAKADIVLLDPSNPRVVEPLIESPHVDSHPVLSPDDRWMAYASDEIGERPEVFVVSFPSRRFKTRISKHGGDNPIWGLDGTNELYYLGYTEAGEVAMMAATVSTADGFRVAGERELFRKPYLKERLASGLRPYDISPRDGRFLFLVPADSADQRNDSVTIWQMRNWIEAR